MVLLKPWPGKSFSWLRIRACDTASFCKLWAAEDLPAGSVTGLQIVRNVLSEGRGLRWVTHSHPGSLPGLLLPEEVVPLQVNKETPPSSGALIPEA